jgi:thiol-disulfide isomerase/thioredoxin
MRRVAVLLALGLLLTAASCTGGRDEPAAPDDGVSLEGDDIGDYTLAGLGPDADPVDLPSLRGRPVVVNFFASTCGPCVREMPALESANQTLDGEVTFVGVAVADRVDDALALVDRTGVTNALAADPTGEVFATSGATLLPATMLLDGEGEVFRRFTGEIGEDDLFDALAELDAAEEPG